MLVVSGWVVGCGGVAGDDGCEAAVVASSDMILLSAAAVVSSLSTIHLNLFSKEFLIKFVFLS